ncbi:MAG: HPF/RaiA family ribosome-associated protein [Nitrospirales bacterium]|nr:HPF/RaiA family ribosome-associated protein [Nitrospira sp.]MDR4500740.1 HPF/RaiA family ribosome-associated protein [Nitrospirales bacterium]
MDIKIESRNVGMTPRWKTEIETRVAALESESIQITHARVTLTKNAHHKKGEDNAEALVLVTIPKRHTVTARKEAKTFEEAIRRAFLAVENEIRKMHEKRASKESGKAGANSLKGIPEETIKEEIA